MWEKQYWKGADSDGGPGEGDGRLDFAEALRLCKRLNVASSEEALTRLFKVRPLIHLSATLLGFRLDAKICVHDVGSGHRESWLS